MSLLDSCERQILVKEGEENFQPENQNYLSLYLYKILGL
ncbi:hypothetical protein TDIS_0490 [Thermosulfurimonas dismutans]|uniref:Uncharacterized protein n=1 Tax=Thermosulfurimonas dismutans TaxID=999894 RepID=A0A179D5A0_9BACT|nr:hypothetical protein TDIS_0490 [Thermosulfurimonas dismutans]